MKERPIIFNGNMVRAILEGRKTQTRRPVRFIKGMSENMMEGEEGAWCPFGAPGDRLWVRETWADESKLCRLAYKADIDDGINCLVKRWTPSIHMPRCASRITLEIVSVRVERVQDISEKDAKAEGAGLWFETGPFTGNEKKTHKSGFESLWDSIYAKKHPWSSNPWVWVIEFKILAEVTK